MSVIVLANAAKRSKKNGSGRKLSTRFLSTLIIFNLARFAGKLAIDDDAGVDRSIATTDITLSTAADVGCQRESEKGGYVVRTSRKAGVEVQE